MMAVELVLCAVVTLTSLVTTGPILRALPPPSSAHEGIYRILATPGFIAAVTVVTAASALWCAWHSELWFWLPVVGPTVLAVCIDARTRYLPKALHGCALVLLAAIPVWCLAHGDAGPTLRALGAAAAATTLFWVLWRFAKFGFGDVRLAGLLGACAGAHSWQVWYLGLLLGTTLGALWGLMWRLRKGSQAFPYGPALFVGALCALALG